MSSAYNPVMALSLRSYEPHDFATLHRLDRDCFPAGISYSKLMLKYFLKLPSADCLVATEDAHIVGFILTEENPPLAHVITLDVAETYRRRGAGSSLLAESERNLALRGVRTILLETATDNESGIAFWKRHGYGIEAVLKRYYLGRVDAYEMRKILPTASVRAGTRPGENS
jgi:ribosomal protein S18 acetylase RimI-like enzyme